MADQCPRGECQGVEIGRYKIRAGWVVKFRCSVCRRVWTERA